MWGNAIPTTGGARPLAVDSDHPAIRGPVIAFVTDRSRQRRACIPSWGKHERRADAGTRGGAAAFTRLRKRAGWTGRIESRGRAPGVHHHNPAAAHADRRERIWAIAEADRIRAAAC